MNKHSHYEKVSNILYWLIENQRNQPSLAKIAKKFGISEFHLQRIFQDFAGVSPKQFLKHLSKEEAIFRLKRGHTVLETALDVGLSGPGRLHDLLVTTEAITPGEARRLGHGVCMNYGFGPTPFGDAVVAWTPRGISFLGFSNKHGRVKSLASIKGQWQGIELVRRSAKARRYLEEIFELDDQKQLKVWLRGSPFQLKVWEALLRIPRGSHCTYGQIADYLGNPKASRAVGTAIARNPVSWLIPCHRVITSAGTLGGYRWGVEAKQALIGFEACNALKLPKRPNAARNIPVQRSKPGI